MKSKRALILASTLMVGVAILAPWNDACRFVLFREVTNVDSAGVEVGWMCRWDWQGHPNTFVGDYWRRSSDGRVLHWTWNDVGRAINVTEWSREGVVVKQDQFFNGSPKSSPPWWPHPDYWSMEEL